MGISLGFDLGRALSRRIEIIVGSDEDAARDIDKRLIRQPNRSLKH